MDETPPVLKQCSKCKQFFPATPDFFQRNNAVKSGFRPECKACKKVYQKTYNDNHADHRREYHRIHRGEIKIKREAYYAAHKEEISERRRREKEKNRQWMTEYRQRDVWKKYHKEWYKRYKETHKDEIKENSRRYLENNRDLIRERRRLYGQTERGKMAYRVHKHKRKAQKRTAGGSYTVRQLQEQIHRQKSRCYYCNGKLAAGKGAWHADHIVPLSRGGSNDISNIVVTCPTCNLRKNDKLPHEWPEGGRLL